MLQSQKYKRFVRYEKDKNKKKYAFALEAWRSQPRGTFFAKKLEEAVRQLEKCLRLKTPAQYDEGKISSTLYPSPSPAGELCSPPKHEMSSEEPIGEAADSPIGSQIGSLEDISPAGEELDSPAGEELGYNDEETFLSPNAGKVDEEKGKEANTLDEVPNDLARTQEVAGMTIVEEKGESNSLNEVPVDLPPTSTEEIARLPGLEDDGVVDEFTVNQVVYKLLVSKFKDKPELFDHLKRNRVAFYKYIGLKKGRQLVNLAKKIDGRLDGGGKRSSIYGEFFCQTFCEDKPMFLIDFTN